VFGDSAETGKPTGDDLREGKQTMLIARARQLGDSAQIALIESSLGNTKLSETEVTAVQQALIDCGVHDDIESRISSLLETALESLADLPDEAKSALTELALMSTKREK
jgi:geranylgeranyl diphosphate synthase type I